MSGSGKHKLRKGPIVELMEYAQKEQNYARIEVTDKSGSSNKPLYTIAAFIDDRQFPSIQSKSVKEGKVKAAEIALEVLRGEGEPVSGVVTSWAAPTIRDLFRKDSNKSISSVSSEEPEEFPDVPLESPIPGKHPVNVLEEYGRFRGLPCIIKILNHTGPSHSPTFSAAAQLGERKFPTVQGRTKTEARAKAASIAISNLDEEGDLAPWLKQQKPTGGAYWYLTSRDGDVVKLDKHPVIILTDYALTNKQDCKFEILDKKGPSHSPIYSMCASLDDNQYPPIQARNNKEGKLLAATEALQKLYIQGKYSPT